MFQSLPHTHDIIHRITESSVTFNDATVGSPNLQIDFRTARLAKQALRLRDDGSGQTVSLMFGVNRQVIEPSTMSLVTSHHTRHNLAVEHTY